MRLSCTLPFEKSKQFKPIFLDYISEKETLKELYGYFPHIQNFEKQIALKQFDDLKRRRLVEVLLSQYKDIPDAPTEQIELLLEPTTFTLTTGHQLNIYTGTLYFHYKIQTVIRAAEELKKQFPKYDFVPIYWQASEDHDLEEIQFMNLFGKKYVWQTEQTGAVGRMHTQKLEEIGSLINEEEAKKIGAFYQEADNLAEATRMIVHHYYGDKGLVVMDADDKQLKEEFIPVIEKELFEQPTFKAINQSNRKLDQLGYRTQIHPREINLFYLEDGLRERIVRNGSGEFEVLGTDISFSKAQIQEFIKSNPQRFSPNVALRPLYQEIILPNLSYTGGPGELAYWLQLKGVFETFDVPFPILLPRNFVLILPRAIQKKIQKTGLSTEELFEDVDSLRVDYVKQNATGDIELHEEKAQLEQLYDELIQKGKQIEPTLEKSIAAEKQKALKGLDNLAKRLRKAEEGAHETAIKQIASIKDKLFPNGSLQERHDNFLSFYINNSEFLSQLQVQLNPFLLEFLIFEE